MDPAEFQVTEFGLSSKNAIIIMSILTVLIFIYLFYSAKKSGKIKVNGIFRPLLYVWNQIKNNRSTIAAIINKNLVGKYNNSYFGILWNIISPILLVTAILFIFVGVKGLYPDRHYWTYICSGLFVVTMCRQALGGTSFRNNGMIIKKLPNPAWSVAFADTVSNFINCILPFIILLIAIGLSGKGYNPAALAYLPLLFIILFVFCFGLTLIFSVLTVLVGDIRQVMVTVSRVIIWISPVFFYLCDCNETLYNLTMCNPFAYIVEPFHQAASYGIIPDYTLIGVAALNALFALGLGMVLYLRKVNRVRELI